MKLNINKNAGTGTYNTDIDDIDYIGTIVKEDIERIEIINNYFHTEKPDFYIKIGIKDSKVVEIDWSEMVIKEYIWNNLISPKDRIKKISKYLKMAIKFIKICLIFFSFILLYSCDIKELTRQEVIQATQECEKAGLDARIRRDFNGKIIYLECIPRIRN